MVPQGGVGDRHLVTIPQGVVGDRLPWGGERHGGVRVQSVTIRLGQRTLLSPFQFRVVAGDHKQGPVHLKHGCNTFLPLPDLCTFSLHYKIPRVCSIR